MATFTITIPDDKVAAVIDAFASQYHYTTKIEDANGAMIDNPTSKAQFAKNVVNSFIKQVYIGAQIKALDATKQTTIATAETYMNDITTV